MLQFARIAVCLARVTATPSPNAASAASILSGSRRDLVQWPMEPGREVLRVGLC